MESLFDLIPDEILGEIFSWLDPTSRFLVSPTSKRWRKVALSLTVPLKTVRQFEEACKRGDCLSIFQTKFNPMMAELFLPAACEKAQRYLVEVLLKKVDGDIMDAFCAAAQSGDLELMQHLIDQGDVRWGFRSENHWNYALGAACEGNRPEMIKFLLDKGATDHHLAFEGACRGGHCALALEWFRSDDIYFNRALEASIQGGNIQLVRFFLDLDLATLLIQKSYPVSPPSQKTWEGFLSTAARTGDEAIFDLILSKVSRPADFDHVLEQACQGGHRKLAERCIKLGATDWNAGLVGAARGGHRDLVRWMVDLGANEFVNPLMSACFDNDEEMVRCLVALGAKEFNEALEEACALRRDEMVRLMISLGATECGCGKSLEEHPLPHQ